ncbi:MAG: PAS domain S-box protein [Desulfococcaceae bacterium]
MPESPPNKTQPIPPERLRELKARARAILLEKGPVPERLESRDARRLIQELQIYQIELEMQNEELLRTQVRLQTSAELYRDLYDQAPVAFINLDHEGGILDVNHAAVDLLGQPRERLLRMNIYTLIQPGNHDTFYRHCREVVKIRRKRTCELLFHRMDDTVFPARVHTAGVPDETGASLQLRMAITDISDQKAVEAELEARVQERTTELQRANDALKGQVENRMQIERQLRMEHAFRRTIEETVPSGILACDLSGALIYVNRSFCEMVGWPAGSLLGRKPPFPFWPDGQGRTFENPRLKILRNSEPLHGVEFQFQRRDGTVFWGLVFITDLADGSGNISGRLASVMDISAQKRSEAELHTSRERLRQVSEKLVAAQDEERRRIAQELHDSVGAGLTAVKFGLETAMRQMEETPLLVRLVDRLKCVIRETQSISRNLHPSVLDDLGLLPAIRSFCRDFESVQPRMQIDHNLDIGEASVPRNLKLLIFRVVQEAVNNAAKHSEGDRVRLELTESDGRIALTLADNGGGFDVAEALQKGFRQGGLGLSSMKERTELAGGRFEIRSAPGQGTVIRAEWKID